MHMYSDVCMLIDGYILSRPLRLTLDSLHSHLFNMPSDLPECIPDCVQNVSWPCVIAVECLAHYMQQWKSAYLNSACVHHHLLDNSM